MWTWKPPSLAHIKVLGCEAFIRNKTQDKWEPKVERCIFICCQQKSFGYLFYRASENVVFVARMGVFRERELVSKEDNEIMIDLEENQESSNEGRFDDTSSQPEAEPIEPTDYLLILHRFSRVITPPSFYGFHIMTYGDSFIRDILVN